jgi:hypothetical protein
MKPDTRLRHRAVQAVSTLRLTLLDREVEVHSLGRVTPETQEQLTAAWQELLTTMPRLLTAPEAPIAVHSDEGHA